MNTLIHRLRWLILAPIFLVACSSTGSLGLVGRVRMDGEGRLWTDGSSLFATGAYGGDFLVFGKATEMAVTIPISVTDGEAFLWHNGETETRKLWDPMPLWVEELLPSFDIEDLGISFEELPPDDPQPPVSTTS